MTKKTAPAKGAVFLFPQDLDRATDYAHALCMRKTLCILLLLLTACAPAGEQVAETVRMPQTNNHIDYVEFAAEDLGVAKAFYASAFGWTFQDWGPDYVSFEGAGIDGGIRGGETPANGSALIILYADDLEESEKRVVAAGGEITKRHDFPGGRRFHFRDPSGNVLGVWAKAEDEN